MPFEYVHRPRVPVGGEPSRKGRKPAQSVPPSNHSRRATGIPEVWASNSLGVTPAQAGWTATAMSAHGVGESTSIDPAVSSRAIINAVTSLLRLATTIVESEVAGAPSIVVPEALASALRPSRTTVIVTAGFARARRSKARFTFVIAGADNGSTVVLVDVVDVVDVVVDVDVVVVDVVVVDVVVDVVVSVVVGDLVVATVVAAVGDTDAVGSEPDADAPAHPAVNTSAPAIRTTGCRRTPSR